MTDEAFYSTSAQVLPTILIALGIEFQVLAGRLRSRVQASADLIDEIAPRIGVDRDSEQQALEIVRRVRNESQLTVAERFVLAQAHNSRLGESFQKAVKQYHKDLSVFGRRIWLAWFVATVFLAGEGAAVGVLLVGEPDPYWTRYVMIAALALLSLLAVILPLLRLPRASDLPEPKTMINAPQIWKPEEPYPIMGNLT